MSHILRITDGGSTVTFSSTSNMYIAEYQPQSSKDLSKPIEERARIGFTNSIADIQANLHALDALLYQAGNYDRNRSGPRVYVEFDPGTSGTAYRSMLYSGIAHAPEGMLGGDWAAANLEFEIEWTRRPYWEGPLTQILLTNPSSTGSTDGATVYNATDGTYYNWVAIGSTLVTGDLPAAIKLMMVNQSTGANDTDEVYVFHNAHSNPSTFSHILEFEQSTYTTVLTTSTSSVSSNNGKASMTWTDATLTKVAEWSLTSAQMSAAAGGRFALLTRSVGLFPYADCWMRFQLEKPGTNDMLWESDLSLFATYQNGRELVNFGPVRLPPYLYGSTTIGAMQLALYAQRNSTDNTVVLDYVQLSPISGDAGWLRFKAATSGIATGESLVHDATEGWNYHVDASTNFIGEFTQYGGPLLLFPGKDQRLYFLTCDYTGLALPSQQWTVKLWYRPRRTSI